MWLGGTTHTAFVTVDIKAMSRDESPHGAGPIQFLLLLLKASTRTWGHRHSFVRCGSCEYCVQYTASLELARMYVHLVLLGGIKVDLDEVTAL